MAEVREHARKRDKERNIEERENKSGEKERERKRTPTRCAVGTYVLLYFATVIFINQRYSTTSGDVEGWNL